MKLECGTRQLCWTDQVHLVWHIISRVVNAPENRMVQLQASCKLGQCRSSDRRQRQVKINPTTGSWGLITSPISAPPIFTATAACYLLTLLLLIWLVLQFYILQKRDGLNMVLIPWSSVQGYRSSRSPIASHSGRSLLLKMMKHDIHVQAGLHDSLSNSVSEVRFV